MWDGFDELIEVQRLDQAIARLEGEARGIPAQIAALEAELGRARAAWEASKAAAAALAKERRDRERELEEEMANQRKKQGRLFEIKTNQEYSAVLKEIEQLREKISGLETRILEIMEEQEAVAKRVAAAEGAFQAAEAEGRRERAAREAVLAQIQGQLAAALKARRETAAKVERELYQTYARIMKIRDGTALVPVRDGSCGGCFVALPPQTYAEVRNTQRRITCPYCERILYQPAGGPGEAAPPFSAAPA